VSTLGKIPRNFAIDPSGRFVLAANQDTDNIVIFGIDEKSGLLKYTGNQIEVPTPVCVQFAPRAQPTRRLPLRAIRALPAYRPTARQ